VQFGAFCGYQVIKSGTENRRFSVPLLKVGRNLPSLLYRFRGPCLVQETINAVEPEFAAHGYAK